MMARTDPIGKYNFIVNLNGGGRDPGKPLGGFSEVSGLHIEGDVSEHRDGIDTERHVGKIPGLNKTGDVTLKRGVIANASDLQAWITETRAAGHLAQRDVTITQSDRGEQPDTVVEAAQRSAGEIHRSDAERERHRHRD
jgi:phage tail-like protein